ncbi:hypothetical protein CLI64_11125 [Nostoc sp. CENA543]|uniref:AP2/ERF family transcription factor n=1 Tax=Nostoc sp. CENA543 TaxID=1869241 RepID=UPI000CA3CFAE|nr:AP2/ERF family transcription factor [Nostoc sp. CENA543]AUT00906.1 hypothetical protein CLI64_11125 [Nostoc sp. CENA543]
MAKYFKKHPTFIGVRYDFRLKLWEAYLPDSSPLKSYGLFEYELQAVLTYDNYARHLKLPVNFEYEVFPLPTPVRRRSEDEMFEERPKSQYRGVYYSHGGWATYYYNPQGKQLYLGTYDTEECAARAVDRAAIRYEGRNTKNLNFTYGDAVLYPPEPRKRTNAAPYGKYIYLKQDLNLYQVSVYGKYLGIYKLLEDAITVRDAYCRERGIPTTY